MGVNNRARRVTRLTRRFVRPYFMTARLGKSLEFSDTLNLPDGL